MSDELHQRPMGGEVGGHALAVVLVVDGRSVQLELVLELGVDSVGDTCAAHRTANDLLRDESVDDHRLALGRLVSLEDTE